MVKMTSLKVSRVLLKLSGEALKGELSFGQDYNAMSSVVKDISTIHKAGIKLGIVVGGGNFLRGRDNNGMDRASADYMGMLATVMNGLALQSILESKGIKSKIFSSVPMESICYTYARAKALNAIEDKVVIFAGGTGNPFVSTDTAAVCRAIEMRCDMMVKATQVGAVYSEDPRLSSKARKYDTLSHAEVISKNLQIIDLPAIFMAKEHKLPIMVISIDKISNLVDITKSDGNFTLIS